MNLLDGAILGLLLGVAWRGQLVGLLRQLGLIGGFSLGLLMGALIAPWLAKPLAYGTGRTATILFVFFAVAVCIGGIGSTLGQWLAIKVHERRWGSIDRIFGMLFGVGATLTAIWLTTAAFARTAGPYLTAEIQTSRILRSLDANLPPAPDIITKLENSMTATGLPRVFAGLEPEAPPPVTGPNAEAVNAAAAIAAPATVRLESLGCGGLLEGSGFVAAPETVVTNAHVVAGIKTPVVQDWDGGHRGTTVYFDPRLDIAVIRVPELATAPLSVGTTTSLRGTIGAVLGYPGGGDLTVKPAAVLGVARAVGRDIYGSGLVTRQIYELQAEVMPGSSGGPLVAPNGTVLGMIFAKSTANEGIAYALTTPEITKAIQLAGATSVDTGSCLDK